jgi:nucleotide-binding universal stress UspA family protein
MRILLAMDHTECSTAAAKAVIAQFPPQHTDVQVLHVDEWPKGLPSAMVFAAGSGAAQSILTVLEGQRRAAEALVASTAEQLRAAGFTTTTSVRDGDPRKVIPACAEEWHADLVVLGSHDRKGLDRLILGTVSDSVARRARCSVEIVRAAPNAA